MREGLGSFGRPPLPRALPHSPRTGLGSVSWGSSRREGEVGTGRVPFPASSSPFSCLLRGRVSCFVHLSFPVLEEHFFKSLRTWEVTLCPFESDRCCLFYIPCCPSPPSTSLCLALPLAAVLGCSSFFASHLPQCHDSALLSPRMIHWPRMIARQASLGPSFHPCFLSHRQKEPKVCSNKTRIK